jgi:hypothetical protein
VGGTLAGELAKSLKTGGAIVVYGAQSGQFPAFSPRDFLFRGLSSTDSGSAIGYATRHAWRSRRFTRS